MKSNLKWAWEVVQRYDKFSQLDVKRWFEVEFFSVQWWVLVLFLIIPWLFWFKLSDKRRLMEITLFGTLMTIMTSYLDTIGMDLKLWFYPTELIPLGARSVSFDFSVVPVGFMLFYQYFGSKRFFLVALILMAGLYAFVGEPLCIKMQLVYYRRWKVIYSFFFYILTGSIAKYVLYEVKKFSR